jgi:hypothetical protein
VNNTFDIYYENADTDDPKEYRMTIEAWTMADALQIASEYLEVPSHDLVARHADGTHEITIVAGHRI